MTKKYYCDGFLHGSNPATGGGYTICDEAGAVIKRAEYKVKNFTCNHAELLGVVWALQLAEPSSIVSSDSVNAIGWARKGKAKARPDLNPIAEKANVILREKGIMLLWEPRGLNLAGKYNEKVLKQGKREFKKANPPLKFPKPRLKGEIITAPDGTQFYREPDRGIPDWLEADLKWFDSLPNKLPENVTPTKKLAKPKKKFVSAVQEGTGLYE